MEETRDECEQGNNDDFYYFDRSFAHTLLDTPFDISVFFDNPRDENWGIKEVIVLARTCHWACVECFGATAS